MFFDWFGEGVEKYACIILTGTSNEEEMNEYLKTGEGTGLHELVTRCGGRTRVACIDNTAASEKDKQVKRIIEMVEEIKRSNENAHFTNVAFKLATSYAYSKNSKQITNDSILILGKAGLSMIMTNRQCKMLNMIFDIQESKATSQVERNQAKSTRRRDRKVDIESVRAGPTVSDVDTGIDEGTSENDPLNELKDDVNTGKRHYVDRFIDFLHNVFNYAKTNYRCTLQ